MYKVNKLIGFMCIFFVMLLKLLGKFVCLIIGNDFDIIEVVEIMGGEYIICFVDDVVVDVENKVVIIFVYMLVVLIFEVVKGIDKLVVKVLDLIE